MVIPCSISRRTAGSAFVPKRLDNPALQQLTYDQYRDIRFKPEAGIWRNEQVPFRVELFPAGFLFQTPVKVSVVESGMARESRRRPNMFVLGSSVAKQLANQALPLSGFRVRTRLNSRSVWDEFLVFQGARIFAPSRATALWTVGARPRDPHGASGRRGVSGVHALLDRAAAANASAIVVHALLDSPSDDRRLPLLDHARRRKRSWTST